ELGADLQFQAARADLAGGLVERLGGRARRHVVLRQLVHRGRDVALAAGRLVADAGLVLLAGGRLEQLALLVGADAGVEAVGVAHVRRDAVVEQVDRARPLGEFRALPAGRRAGVLVGDARMVLAQAQGEAPRVPGER